MNSPIHSWLPWVFTVGSGSSWLPEGFLQLRCAGFSFPRFLLLPSTAVRPEGSAVVALRLRYSGAHEILFPGPAMECPSPTLAGQFLLLTIRQVPSRVLIEWTNAFPLLQKKEVLRVHPKSSHHKEKTSFFYFVSIWDDARSLNWHV